MLVRSAGRSGVVSSACHGDAAGSAALAWALEGWTIVVAIGQNHHQIRAAAVRFNDVMSKNRPIS